MANLRRASAATKRDLERFKRAVSTVHDRALRALHIEGKRVHKLIATRFAVGNYANATGAVVPIKNHGAAWAKRKARLKLDPRRGIARKGVLKQLKSPFGFIPQPKGFTIDLKAPALTITGRATVGKSLRATAVARGTARAFDGTLTSLGIKFSVTGNRSFAVNDYVDAFADAKAPGLGALADADREALRAAVNAALTKHLSQSKKEGLSIARRAAAQLNVRFSA